MNIIFHYTKFRIPYTKIPSVKTDIFVMKTAICAPNIPKMQICFSISIFSKKNQNKLKNPQHTFELTGVFYAGNVKYTTFAKEFYNLCIKHSEIFQSANFRCNIISC